MTRKAPGLIVSIRSTGNAKSYWTAFHDPGDTPVIPRIGEKMQIESGWFVVVDVAYLTRTTQTHIRGGQVHPGNNPGWPEATNLEPGVTEVAIVVKRSTPPPVFQPRTTAPKKGNT